MANKRKYNDQQDPLQTLILGAGKMVWWLISLPFRGVKRQSRRGLSISDRNYIATKRHEIENILRSENEIELRHATLEADKLVDYTMKAQGYGGVAFADRIRNAESHISQNLNNDVWSGHKVRNQIAHENSVQISKSELRSATEKLLKYTKNI